MKKKNLSLSQVKVKSFVTALETTQSGTAKGGSYGYEFTNGDPLCTIDCGPLLPVNTATTCIRRKR